jgi:hypothetical protein
VTLPDSKVDIWNLALQKIGETERLTSETARRPAAEICRDSWDLCLRQLLRAREWSWATLERQITEITEQVSEMAYADAASPYDTFDVPFHFLDNDQLTVEHIDADGVETELTLDDDYVLTPGSPTDARLPQIALSDPLITGETVRMTVATSRHGWDFLYALPDDCVTPIALLAGDARYELTPVANRIPFEIVLNDAKDGKLLCCDVSAADDEFERLKYVAVVDEIGIMPPDFMEALAWRLGAELATGLKKDQNLAQMCLRMASAQVSVEGANSSNEGHKAAPPTPSLAAR